MFFERVADIKRYDEMFEKRIDIKKGALTFHAKKTEKFKMSRLSFNFILPADAEKTPLTRLMLAVMMRGSRKYPTVAKINKRLDELYGATVTWRVISVGKRHIFKISCDMMNNKYRLAGDDTDIVGEVAKLVLDILLDPLKDEKGLLDRFNIASEKKLAIDNIRSKINDQKAYAAEQCRRIMLGDDVTGISTDGTVELIESFSAEQLTENIEYFLKNSVIQCYYIGEDDAEMLASIIGDAFSGVSREKNQLLGNEEAFLTENEEIKEKNEIMDVSQGRLNIGCVCGTVMSDSGYYAMNLFNEIFGGSSVAKLFMNLREKQSLCYYCYSSYHSANGTIMIGCGIKKKNRDKALKEIKDQLFAMKNGYFSDGDVDTAKRAIISGLRQIYDNPSAIEAFSFRRLLANVDENIEQTIEKINSVTKEEIADAAKKVKIDTIYFLSGAGEEEEYDDE